MKQFAGAYSTDVISRFIEVEQELKTPDVISQQIVAKLLNVPDTKFPISQQGVAKLAKKPVKSMVSMILYFGILCKIKSEPCISLPLLQSCYRLLYPFLLIVGGGF